MANEETSEPSETEQEPVESAEGVEGAEDVEEAEDAEREPVEDEPAEVSLEPASREEDTPEGDAEGDEAQADDRETEDDGADSSEDAGEDTASVEGTEGDQDEAEPAAEAQPEAEAETELEADAETEPEADAEAEPEPEVETEPEAEAEESEPEGEPTVDEPEPEVEEPVEEAPAEEPAAEDEQPAAAPEPAEDEPELARTTVLPAQPPASPARTSALPQRPAAPKAAPAPIPRPAAPAAPPAGRPAAETPEHPLDVFADAERPRRRAGRVLGAVLAVLVVLAAAYVGAGWALADRVPRGTTVAGVDIGGLEGPAAVAALEEGLRTATAEPIVVTAGEGSATIDPAVAGLVLDADATVETLTGFTLEPARLWQHLFGLGEREPVTRVDRAALEEAVRTVAVALAKEPVDGTIVFADGAAHATAAEEGLAVDEAAAVELLEHEWLTTARPVELPTVPVPPTITQEETDRALAELAAPLASGPVGVVVEGQVAELPARVVTGAATIVPEGSRLELRLDGELLVEEILKRTTDLLSDAKDARFEFVDGTPRIVPGTAGSTLDPEHVAERVRQAALGDPRTANIELTPVDPEQTTKKLEQLGIKEIVSSFDTPVTADAQRNKNLARGAELVTGTLVLPGETFSLMDTIGPINAGNGYVDSGVVVNGVLQQGMGGGLSQMGTTMYNAAYFAGYEDVEHRPHTYYFSRYPEGREATVYEGQLDVKWRNNTPYGALLRSYLKDGRLHVEVWSTKHFEVQTSKSARSHVVAPTTRYSTAPGCVPQAAGSPGFEVTNTRVVLLDGEEVERTSYTWRYNPQDAIVCGQKPKPKDPKDD